MQMGFCSKLFTALGAGFFGLLMAGPATAGCGDRPGTPVDMTATQSDNQIQLDFTNTATEAPIYWDIEVTDGAGHGLAGGAAGVRGTRTQATGGAYSELGRFQLTPIQGANYKPNTTYCFRVRARTAGGTEGCVSKLWNNPVCVTTPDTSVNQFCSTYARDAINQFNYLRNVKMAGNCGDEGARWTSTWLQHYNWCIAVRANPQTAGAPDFERLERNKRLEVCSGYMCLNNVCKQIRTTGKAKTTTPAPPPPPPPPAPENQCKVTVWVTNDECVNVDGTPSTFNTPGVLQTFGCAATEDEALQLAKIKFHLEEGPKLSDDDPPCPGCCTYKKKVVKGCACSVRTYNRKIKEKPCLRGMIRTTGGYCRCPAGMRWNGSWCRRYGTSAPKPPPATSPARSTTTPPAPCPASRPVGSSPNCCPSGTVFSDGVCRRLAKPTTSTAGGGSSTSSGAGNISSSGGGTIGTCPRSRPVGAYPHCCPRGMIYRGHMCRHDFSRKTAPAGKDGGTGGASGVNSGNTDPCPASRPVGAPPNCCPSGTIFAGGACRRLAKPTPNSSGGGSSTTSGREQPQTQTPSTTQPSKARCSGGRRGRPPHCFCTGGRRFIGGRCRFIPKPTPGPKKGDEVIVK